MRFNSQSLLRILLAGCILLMAFQFAACQNQDGSDFNQEDARLSLIKDLKEIAVTLGEDTVGDSRYKDQPWVAERVNLGDSGVIVSLDLLQKYIFVYEMVHGQTLGITAEEIVGLYTSPTEKGLKSFKLLTDWYLHEYGNSEILTYNAFIRYSFTLYQTATGKLFTGKELARFTAEDCCDLTQWAVANINYDEVKRILTEDSTTDEKRYVRFLFDAGFLTKDGDPIAQP